MYTICSFQFRRNVADIIRPEHDDYFLLRWLRGLFVYESVR